jgi:hypothetical protein
MESRHARQQRLVVVSRMSEDGGAPRPAGSRSGRKAGRRIEEVPTVGKNRLKSSNGWK